jgi:hypothetical protein
LRTPPAARQNATTTISSRSSVLKRAPPAQTPRAMSLASPSTDRLASPQSLAAAFTIDASRHPAGCKARPARLYTFLTFSSDDHALPWSMRPWESACPSLPCRRADSQGRMDQGGENKRKSLTKGCVGTKGRASPVRLRSWSRAGADGRACPRSGCSGLGRWPCLCRTRHPPLSPERRRRCCAGRGGLS